jgi:DNA-binding NtrC family response regulator
VEKNVGKAIVIVDDETSFTELLAHLLGEHFNCPIVTFSNPLKMLDALPSLNIGVLVTDYYMPHCNGLDLIRKVGELLPDPPPCLLITGHAIDDDEDCVMPAHLKEILPKPFRWQQLAGLIQKHWPANTASPLREASPQSLHG